jgi:hypothetical protein
MWHKVDCDMGLLMALGFERVAGSFDWQLFEHHSTILVEDWVIDVCSHPITLHYCIAKQRFQQVKL